MHKTVMEPGWDILQVYPCNYWVDFEHTTRDPIGMLGSKLEGLFTLVCVEDEALKRLNACVKRAGLEREEVVVDAMASGLAVLSEEEKEGGVCLVDIGAGTTDLIIFQGGMVRHIAVIPYGASLLTDDIKKGCQIMESQAERLKIAYGHAIGEQVPVNEVVSVSGIRDRPAKEFSVRSLSAIINCRMVEIIELVDEHLIRLGHARDLSAGVVITGGGANLRGLKELFEYVTSYDTRVGYPNEHLGMPAPEEAKTLQYATAMGLVLLGMQQTAGRKESPPPGEVFRSAADNPAGAGFLKKIVNRTKGFFLDDIDDGTGEEKN